jgi:hypothetical protein
MTKEVQDHRDPLIICKQEKKIQDMSDGIIRIEGSISKLDLRINGTLEKMANHVEASEFWRRFIMTTAVSLVISIIGGAFALWQLAYNLGQYTKQITVNTDRFNIIEEEHRGGNKL